MAGNTGAPGASVASRVLALLFAFDHDGRRLTLSQLAARSGLPLTTAHRLLGDLVAGGALERLPTGEYVVGRRLWDLGLLAPVQVELRHVAAPFLQDVHAATRATVHLAVRDHAQALYVERLSGRASVPVVSRVGSRLPLHATGVGKVLLAHAPDPVREEALRDLHRVTAYTVTTRGRLLAQLDRVRRDDYAVTVEEMTLGACSLAVPVHGRGATGRPEVVAALGVVVPTLRRERNRLLAALQVAARGISRSLAS